MYDMFEYENDFVRKGYKNLAGIDEAGRGPLAGPVVCACVIMPLNQEKIIDGVNDSKKLSEKKRLELYDKITKTAICYNIVEIGNKTIDKINILNATKLAMAKCVNDMKEKVGYLLVDAVNGLEVKCEYLPIIKGDSKSYLIACASILAKVHRDKLMEKFDLIYPKYNFKKHKGYGTKEHIENLKKYGKCEIHRDTFIKNFVS